MIPVKIVALVTLLYIGLLFAVASFADRRQEAGRSVVANSYVYSLSLAVYFTSWSFYGLVGQAATTGIAFLAPFLGATLIAFVWWFLLRKMVRVCKEQNIASIADFIASRYGKSPLIGGIVTIFSIMAIIPYIALQLKAVAYTFNLLIVPPPAIGGPAVPPTLALSLDTTFVVALVFGLFGVLFGARQRDASVHLEGLVAAVALQSVVKLIAFLAVGIFVTYGLFDGFTDIFSRFTAQFPDRVQLFALGTPQFSYGSWFSWLFFSMAAIMFLPRQFHVMVIENVDEKHIKDAMWRFPVYMFLLTLFVMPIALGGLILNVGNSSAADYFVLNLPLQTGHPCLAMLAFIGGFSASSGMVMVESVVLSTMILNHLIIPIILKFKVRAEDISGLLIAIRRAGIFAVILLGYLYFRVIGESYSLINIGVVSLIAATQLAPAIIGGLYWRNASRRGAASGLVLGFLLWLYTLLIPLFVQSGALKRDILEYGPLGIGLLRPLELFGLSGLDMLSHALFWTMFFNIGTFIAVSLLCGPDKGDSEQAEKFVDVFDVREEPRQRMRMSKAPSIVEFVGLMTKFIGEKQAHAAIADYLEDKTVNERGGLSEYELPMLKRFTERALARSVGAAAAGVIVDSYLAARGSELEDVFDIFGTVTLSRSASKEQLSVLYETARIVAGKADLQAILEKILEHLQQQFKFDICVVRTLDENSEALTIVSHRGMSSRHLKEWDRALNLETYAGTAFLTNSVVVVNDTDFMDKPASAHVVRQEGIASFAHAPITVEGRAVGVLSAFSKTLKGIFTDEFIELFTSLAGQVGLALRNARQTEKLIKAKEHEKELQIARVIQLGLLPTRSPDMQGISLAGMCIPAREVGGDYYDFIHRGQATLDLIIADVSGHNIGAALLMAEVRTFIQAEAKNLQQPGKILSTLNEFLHEDLSRAELFITMFYLSFDTDTGRLSFANAGHNPPMVWRSETKSFEWLDTEGLILGVKRDVVFEEKQFQMQPGDSLILYTDGITEAANSAGEMFGEGRLCALIEENHKLSPQQIINNLIKQVRSYSGTHILNDDVTLVILKVETSKAACR
jgi:serine phosphatase RsbU (regulator of sigma subunit)/Na+/proline symporter